MKLGRVVKKDMKLRIAFRDKVDTYTYCTYHVIKSLNVHAMSYTGNG